MLTLSRTLVTAGAGMLVAAGCGQKTPETAGSITAPSLSWCQAAIVNGHPEVTYPHPSEPLSC